MSSRVETSPRKLIAVGFLAVFVQTAVVSQVPPFAGSADVLPLVTISVGLLCGSLTGAVFGFAIGLGLDLIVGQPLGQYALIDLAIGYAAGRFGELRAPAGSLYLVPVGAAAAAFAAFGYGLLQVLFGGGAELSIAVAKQGALAVLWGALLAVPVNAIVRRSISAGSSRGPRSRGRSRAYATGGLSPLTPGRKR